MCNLKQTGFIALCVWGGRQLNLCWTMHFVMYLWPDSLDLGASKRQAHDHHRRCIAPTCGKGSAQSWALPLLYGCDHFSNSCPNSGRIAFQEGIWQGPSESHPLAKPLTIEEPMLLSANVARVSGSMVCSRLLSVSVIVNWKFLWDIWKERAHGVDGFSQEKWMDS